jgi:hypothetical protein
MRDLLVEDVEFFTQLLNRIPADFLSASSIYNIPNKNIPRPESAPIRIYAIHASFLNIISVIIRIVKEVILYSILKI